MEFVQPEDGFLFQPCRYDGTFEAARHPFTLEPVQLPRNETLTAKEVRAVKALLASVASKRAGNLVTMPDGLKASLEFKDLAKQLLVDPRGRMSEPFARFLHALLVAGQWCIRGEEAIVAATSQSVARLPPAEDPRLPADFPPFPRRVVICKTPAEMARLLGA